MSAGNEANVDVVGAFHRDRDNVDRATTPMIVRTAVHER